MNHSPRDPGKNRRFRLTPAMMMGAAVVLLIAATTLLLPANPAPSSPGTEADLAAGANDTVRVQEGCELLQTLSYTRCEHSVTRRVAAPVELMGKTLGEVQPFYEDWQITSFSPKEIEMNCRPELFCPEHMVLLPDGAGKLCVFQNKYGDALALVNELETELADLPASMQEEARLGVGFATLLELEQWLESAES